MEIKKAPAEPGLEELIHSKQEARWLAYCNFAFIGKL